MSLEKLHVGDYYSVEEWDGSKVVVRFIGLDSGMKATKKSKVLLKSTVDDVEYIVPLVHFIQQIRAYHGSCHIKSAY